MALHIGCLQRIEPQPDQFWLALESRDAIGVAEIGLRIELVIVSITAERFAKVLIEENINDALKMLLNTFAVALMTCLIFQSKVLLGIFLTYPEQYFTILFIMLFLGKWIGLRVMEYDRFAPSFK